MSEPRLYLYRKAGREVWDAEMWLPDGRRRVWRTGIADRAEAEAAAQKRLKELLLQAAHPEVTLGAPPSGGHDRDPSAIPFAQADEELIAQSTTPVGAQTLPRSEGTGVQQSAPEVRRPAPSGWSGRFDRWFLGELKAVFG